VFTKVYDFSDTAQATCAAKNGAMLGQLL